MGACECAVKSLLAGRRRAQTLGERLNVSRGSETPDTPAAGCGCPLVKPSPGSKAQLRRVVWFSVGEVKLRWQWRPGRSYPWRQPQWFKGKTTNGTTGCQNSSMKDSHCLCSCLTAGASGGRGGGSTWRMRNEKATIGDLTVDVVSLSLLSNSVPQMWHLTRAPVKTGPGLVPPGFKEHGSEMKDVITRSSEVASDRGCAGFKTRLWPRKKTLSCSSCVVPLLLVPVPASCHCVSLALLVGGFSKQLHAGVACPQTANWSQTFNQLCALGEQLVRLTPDRWLVRLQKFAWDGEMYEKTRWSYHYCEQWMITSSTSAWCIAQFDGY